MSVGTIISLIISGLTLCLAGWVLQRNPRSKINLWYSLAMACTGLWGLSESMVLESRTAAVVMGWGMFSYAIGVAIPFCFLWFSFYFPYQVQTVSRTKIVIAAALLMIAAVVGFVPGGVVVEGIIRPAHGDLVLNPIGWAVWLSVFVVLFVWSYWNLFTKLARSSGLFRRQLAHVISFTIVPVVTATIFSVLYAFFRGEELGWVSVQTLLLLVVGVFYYLTMFGKKIYLGSS